jgi:hypothetical protein
MSFFGSCRGQWAGRHRWIADPGAGHWFTRLEIEGRERFPIAGPSRQLTVRARLATTRADAGQSVPFYLMDTLDGADNLRGVRERMIGGDEHTSTLRSFESFRIRDRAKTRWSSASSCRWRAERDTPSA